MTDHASAVATERAARSGAVPVHLLLLAALLIGAGLIGTAYWLITFNWLYFLSLVPLILGALLLFTRASGSEHA